MHAEYRKGLMYFVTKPVQGTSNEALSKLTYLFRPIYQVAKTLMIESSKLLGTKI